MSMLFKKFAVIVYSSLNNCANRGCRLLNCIHFRQLYSAAWPTPSHCGAYILMWS